MGRLIRLILVLAATFVFGLITERQWSNARCDRAGGVAIDGVCLPHEDWGKMDE